MHSLTAHREDKKIDFIEVSAFFVVLSIFTRELALGSVYGIDVDYVAYTSYILIFLAIVLIRIFAWNRWLIWGLILILVFSIFSKVLLGISVLPFVKQFLPIVLIYSVVGFVIPRYGIERSFHLYLTMATVAAIIGIGQFLMKLATYGATVSVSNLMIDSVAEEPSHYAAMILPALVYAFILRKKYFFQFVVLVVSVILTFNLTAYLVGLTCLAILYGRSWFFLLLLPILIFVSFELYEAFPRFQLRIDSFLEYFQDRSFYNLHGTPLSFLSNLQVALYNTSLNPLFGCGLGGHEEMYYRYFNFNEFSRLEYLFGINAKSAHSLTIRVLSELGWVGFIAFVYHITKPLRMARDSIYFPIGLACFSHFLCKTLKLGNYFDLGTPFFFLMIYYVYRASKGK